MANYSSVVRPVRLERGHNSNPATVVYGVPYCISVIVLIFEYVAVIFSFLSLGFVDFSSYTFDFFLFPLAIACIPPSIFSHLSFGVSVVLMHITLISNGVTLITVPQNAVMASRKIMLV